MEHQPIRLPIQLIDELLKYELISNEAVVYDGLEEAIIGTCSRPNFPGNVLLIDRSLAIAIFKRNNDWTDEEAIEWMEFNVESLWAGDYTPVICDIYKQTIVQSVN